MDDNDQCVLRRGSSPSRHHADRVLRVHTGSSSDSTDRQPEGGARERAGTPERWPSTHFVSRLSPRVVLPCHTVTQTTECQPQVVKGRGISCRPRPDYEISLNRCIQHVLAHDFAHSAFQAITLDGRVTVARYHQPDPEIRKGGRAHPSDELGGVKSSSLFPNALNVPALRQPGSARIPQRATPLRTSTAASR